MITHRRLTLIAWATFLSFLFIGISSLERPMLAISQDEQPQQTSNIAFVFDLNGLFFDTNKSTVFRQLGMRDTLLYVARNGSSKLKDLFFQILNRVSGTKGNSRGVKDPDGTEIPELMVSWMDSSMSNKKIGQCIISAINNNPQWFANSLEQRLILRMTYAIFSPAAFAASRTFLADLVPFVRSIKKRGAQLYILSNWDKRSFAILKEKYKEFFDLFDGIIISGECGYVKPQPEIFCLLKKQIPAKTICFLDDQQENIDAAQAAGIYTILVKRRTGYLRTGIDTSGITKQAIAILKAHHSSFGETR